MMDKEDLPRDPPDLLFAWLSPIEKKVDGKLHPKSPSLNIPASSPLVTRARTALRKTIKASHVSRNARKLRGVDSTLISLLASYNLLFVAAYNSRPAGL